VYGSKNAGRTWYQYLTKKLIEEVGFTQSTVDECVFYKGKVMYVLYTDDSVLAGPDRSEIEQVIEDIKRAKLDITVEGDIQDFLGINIERKSDGTIHLTQPSSTA
jgi:Reverse transcriptase (RNA-dependent DNA polymerase)